MLDSSGDGLLFGRSQISEVSVCTKSFFADVLALILLQQVSIFPANTPEALEADGFIYTFGIRTIRIESGGRGHDWPAL